LLVLLAPFLTPPLLIGYSWAKSDPRWMGLPLWTEFFYALALYLRVTPCAIVALLVLPRSLDAPAIFLLHRTPLPTLRRHLFFLRHTLACEGRASALTALLAFSDFELAAIWNPRQWTVALFDQHAGGLPLQRSIELALPPAGIAAIFLVAALAGTKTAWRSLPGWVATTRYPRMAAGWAAASVAATIVGPVIWYISQIPGAIGNLAALASLGQDLGCSLLVAGAASAVAFGAARLLADRPRISLLLALPGLFGPLVLSLTLLRLLHLPGMGALRDSMVPVVLGLTLALFPVAALLAAALARAESSPAGMLATSAVHPGVAWRQSHRPVFAAFGIVFLLGWYDFTVTQLLSPPGIFPLFARLHNLIHYGRTDLLSTMILAASATPVLLCAVAALLRHLWLHYVVRYRATSC
jgi:hypothetical protein